jgi:hypothetical protein
MFLVRSAFWLTAAFLLMAPHFGADLGSTMTEIRDHTIATGLHAGQQLIVGQILSDAAGEAASLSSTPSIDLPMQDSTSLVPLPRPRPDGMG